MMDARGREGGTIGDVATSAHLHLCKIAPAAEISSATMRTNGAVGPTALVAVVSNGSKSQPTHLVNVLSGRQPNVPMALPSH